MIDRYGATRYLRESGAEEIHRDQFGILYSKDFGADSLSMVEVINSTPEPDGSFKHYFLSVPPDLRTAHEAVAWTFGMSASEYRPDSES